MSTVCSAQILAKELAGQLQVLENNAHPFYKPKLFVVSVTIIKVNKYQKGYIHIHVHVCSVLECKLLSTQTVVNQWYLCIDTEWV